jgi:hypothetical protein
MLRMLAIICSGLITLSTGALGADAPATVGRAARTDLALTVYNDDLGLVRDTRAFEVPSGESLVQFEDVAARIDPTSVIVRSVTAPEKLAVVEQTFAFDLLSPARLLERWVGRDVELVETGDRLRERVTPAVLLSTKGGNVYRIGDRIAVGHPGRVVLPNLPDDLSARPTLRWRLANSGAVRHEVAVAYLTGGLSWSADYVAVLRPDETAADVTCLVTLTNQSGARFDDASLRLVAGQVNRAAPPVKALGRARDVAMAQEAAAPRFAEESLSEYHLYTLERRATLAEEETKQMRLLAATGVKLAKSFRVVGEPMAWRSRVGDLERKIPVGVYFEFTNDDASRLGVPLPAGTVRLYRQDQSGAQQLIGEDALGHTPRDERVVLRAGTAFDVVASRTQTDFRTLSTEPFQVEVGFAVRVRNRRKEPVTVVVREPIGGEWKVVESTHPAVKVDAATLGFEVAVPAGAEVALRYRAQVGS